ncbi:hypothetical protein Tco_0518097 [Tanacetum coccineum]
MAIPDPLIIEAIQQSSYYPKYLKMVAANIKKTPHGSASMQPATKRATPKKPTTTTPILLMSRDNPEPIELSPVFGRFMCINLGGLILSLAQPVLTGKTVWQWTNLDTQFCNAGWMWGFLTKDDEDRQETILHEEGMILIFEVAMKLSLENTSGKGEGEGDDDDARPGNELYKLSLRSSPYTTRWGTSLEE